MPLTWRPYLAIEENRSRERRGASAVDREVALLNIEHFLKLLAEEADEGKRETVLQLLAEERAKLEALDAADEEPDSE